MMELYLMATRGCLPGLGFSSNTDEQGFGRFSRGLQHFLHPHGANQDLEIFRSFNLHLNQREDESKPPGRFSGSSHFTAIYSNSRWPELIDDVQYKTDIYPDSLLFSFGIAEHCTRQEKISKILASIGTEDGLLDLSMLYGLTGHQQTIRNPFSAYPTWCFTDANSQKSLMYPAKKLYLNEPLLDLGVDRSFCMVNAHHPDFQGQCNCVVSEMKDILSVIADFYVPKDTNKPSERAVLVPYFERRRRVCSRTDSLKLPTEKATSLKSHEQAKEKTSQKKKVGTRTGKGREIHANSYVHACESLLSVIVNRKQQGRTAVLSLKKSGSELPQLLTQFSATVAGLGIAVVFSVACSKVSFCASKLLSAGLGLGFMWLSWAIIKLRNTVISIGRSSAKMGAKEDEMMDRMDRNLKDIYLGAAAVVAVALLWLA